MYTVNSLSECELILECFSYTVPVTSLSSTKWKSALEAKCQKKGFIYLFHNSDLSIYSFIVLNVKGVYFKWQLPLILTSFKVAILLYFFRMCQQGQKANYHTYERIY